MTEYWKSNPLFWCEYCKVWLQDKKNAHAVHEQGIKHKENVAKRLRDMRTKADTDKKQQTLTEASIGQIEAQAKRQYQADLKAAQQLREQTIGEWKLDTESGYRYNSAQKYYFDIKTALYYGGNPPVWTAEPSIPAEARYGASEASAAATPASGTGKPGSAARKKVLPAHPLAHLGGFQMPSTGTIGGAKGVGSVLRRGSATPASQAVEKASKTTKGKPMSKEEQEALAKRQAARARVEQRTKAAFGLG